MHILQSCLSMSLERVGGKSDGGIDLQGWWWLPIDEKSAEIPNHTRRIRVLAQCKTEKRKIGPKYVREMEGVLHRFAATGSDLRPTMIPVSTLSQTSPFATVGLFISSSPFSKMTTLRAHSSPLPLALLHLPCPTPEQYGTMIDDATAEAPNDSIGSVIFNAALGGRSGVLGGDFEPRWEYPPNQVGVGRPAFWWRGNRMSDLLPVEGNIHRGKGGAQ